MVGINSNKVMQALYTEYYKTLLKIKDLIKSKDIPWYMDQKT